MGSTSSPRQAASDLPSTDMMQGQETCYQLCLPLDIIGVIAKFLIDDNAFGTCAALNLTCKAVEEETTPILWKTFVLWGAHKVRALGQSIWSDDAMEMSVEEKKRFDEEWQRIRKGRGAQWIQYVAVPSLSGDKSNSTQRCFSGALADEGLERLKGIIFIGRKFGKQEVELGIMVVLMPAYRYGSLARAVDALQRFGGPIVRKACNDPDGIMMLIREGPSPSPTTSRKTSFSLGSLLYVPQTIRIFRRHASDMRYAAAFMEAVGWLAPESPIMGRPQREVQVREGKAELYERCARLFQKAAKRTPAVASLGIRFYLSETITSPSSVPAMDKDAKSIIDIFRGTYLQTRGRLRLDQLGQFWVGVELPRMFGGFAAWEVRPSITRNALVSGFTLGIEVAFYAVDPWDDV